MNGLLLVDKPGGLTSHDVVARVRRATGGTPVGHLGTLDPMATGLLPLLLGKWTRLAKFYGSLGKAYTGVIRFGFATDTYDAEGARTTELAPVGLTLDRVRELACEFLGEKEQMPPPYSAKKIGGQPAYKLARAGQAPELKAARITVDEFAIPVFELNGDGTADAAFQMRISSGGYVRSVAHGMGLAAGCGAHLAALRRVEVGPLGLSSALRLEEIECLANRGALEERMPHPRTVLPELPSVTADAGTLQRMSHGALIVLPEFSRAPVVKVFAGQRELAGVARRVAGVLFQPEVVLL